MTILLLMPATALLVLGLIGLTGLVRGPRLPLLTGPACMFLLAGGALTAGFLIEDGPATIDAGGLSIRLDMVSVALCVLVSFIGTIVLGFSRRYLHGEAEATRFAGWLMLTIAGVLAFVLSGTIWQMFAGWLLAGFSFRRLLMFYPERAGTRRVARKQAVSAILGNLFMLGAFAALIAAGGSQHVAEINEAARSGMHPLWTGVAATCLVLSALILSAQFPLHGWLTEVMEAPTPVSALLHAGLINAGGFLLIRFADVLLAFPPVLTLLVMVGGFTALFASLVMLTQPAIKTSLAWSTIAQMGFMMLQCGLALFPLALLHIIAHSLYKAHAFLSAGSAVSKISASRRPGPVAIPDLKAVGLAFLVALGLYTAIGTLIGLSGKTPQAVALGAILVLGVAYLFAQGFADKAPRALTLLTAGYASAATLAYFIFQDLATYLTRETLPAAPHPGELEWALMLLALTSFGLTAFAQATFPLWSGHPSVRGLRVHLLNGFYVNALIDRFLMNWRQTDTRTG